MPVLKNPCKVKMDKANGEVGSSGTLILASESQGTNPFEEDSEENEKASFLGNVSPERTTASPGDSGEFEKGLFSGSSEGHYKRRATLEKLVGLSPFRKKTSSKEKAQNGAKGPDRRSFLGRMMIPLTEGNQGQRTPEKRKMRRSSEDFSLLQRFNGRRKESLYSWDCSQAEKENGGSDTLKRMSFLKIGLGGKVRRASLVERLNQTEATEPAPVTEEAEMTTKVKEPLSVLEIMNLIQQRDLLIADEHIIELEEECEQDGQQNSESGESRKDGSRKAKDVVLLYKALLKELWDVLAESLAAKSTYPPLELMVRVIEQEEDTDRKWLEAKGGEAAAAAAAATGPRPRAMKKQWVEAVRRLVDERLRQCAEGRPGSIATLMERLAKHTVEDLCAVKFHLLHAYPKQYEAFSVYLHSYHTGLAQRLTEVAQKELSISELYFVLDWNSNVYQREVLGRPEIAPLVKVQKLGHLLSPEIQQSLEEDCIAEVKTKIMADMKNELQKGGENWDQEADSGEGCQFALSSKVISILKVHVDKAPKITEDFGRRMALCCLTSLAEFLQSFRKKVEGFHKGHVASTLTADSYVDRTIMLVNCCPPFRDYVKHLARFDNPESEAAMCQASDPLDTVTALCNRILADHLFQNLKPYFNKLMKRKWLNNTSEAFPTIMALLSEHAQKLGQMKPEPYQMLVAEVHRRVLVEYIRPLMRVRIICTSSKMRAKMANKLRAEAEELKAFFTQKLKCTSTGLDSAILHLAEMIELEDTPAIQMEVGFLMKAFPDLEKRHVSAILDVRGLQNQAERQNILDVLGGLEGPEGEEPSHSQAFFAEIPTSEVFCIRIKVQRLSHLGLTCLSWLCCRARPQRRQKQRPRENEVESQV